MLKFTLKIKLIIFWVFFFISPQISLALTDIVGESKIFFVDPSYDKFGRDQLKAILLVANPRAYLYFDKELWDSFNQQRQHETRQFLISLAEEFEKKIYPTLTATFGTEWRPGIDNDERITILFHPLIKESGGYTDYGNHYLKSQNPRSNEREMIYLNSKRIGDDLLKSFLAHELVHLITFYQKEKLKGIPEEIWLNELRAEYAPTLLGYDIIYEGSNLQQRVENFIHKSFDSLTEWENKPYDYGIANLFVQYLVDHYGLEILVDSLWSKKNGIASINEALTKNGFKEDFSQIFTNWVIAVFINNCQYSLYYCYKNPHLKEFRVIPQTNFLPSLGFSTLSLIHTTKDWAGNWYKIIGGRDILKIEFIGDKKAFFKLPYVIEDKQGNLTIDFLELDKEQKAILYIKSSTNSNNKAITLLPIAQTNFTDLDKSYPVYQFSLRISTIKETLKEREESEKELKEKLLSKIAQLKKQIAQLLAKINAILAERERKFVTCEFSKNLAFGMRGKEVKCLQEFLKNQGFEIYPEGLVTGYFGPLTKAAVIRFQEKYKEEILFPLGLRKGTGFVGPYTLSKIKKLKNL
jgi:hypothetical protein